MNRTENVFEARCCHSMERNDEFHRYTFLFAFVVVTLFVRVSVSKAQIVPLTSYSMKDGLPSNTILAITQDSRGIMWFGTTNGLSCYDGREFRNYGMKEGLPYSIVQEVFEDRKIPTLMWILAGGSVCKLYQGKITTVTLNTGQVTTIHQDKHGVVWCGTNHGIIQIDGNFTRVFRPAILDTGVIHIADVGDSLIYFAIDGAVIVYSSKSRQYSTIKLPSTDWMRVMKVNRRGDVWIGLQENNLVQLRANKLIATWKNIYTPVDIAFDKHDVPWYCNYYGVWNTIKEDPKVAPIKSFNKENGLLENTLISIAFDSEGNLWLGGRDFGVVKISEQHKVQFRLDEINAYTLSHNYRYAVSDSNGHIWVATSKSIMEVWRDENHAWRRYDRHGERESVTRSLFLDNANRLWIMSLTGTRNMDRIFCYEMKSDSRYRRSRLKLRFSMPVKPGYGNALLVAKDFSVWQAGGFGIMRTRTIRGVRQSQMFCDALRLHPDYFREMFEDREGNMWVGSFIGELVRLHIDPRGAMHIKRFGAKDGFSKDGILCITQDGHGRILVGTQSAGLYALSDTMIVAHYDDLDFRSQRLKCITFDSWGRLWLGTGTGIKYERSPGSMKFKTSNLFSGINPYFFGITKEKVLWYVTSTDLHLYELQPNSDHLFTPPVFITSVKVNGVRQNEHNNLSLSYNQNNLEIQFIGIGFRNERMIQYQYRLVGLDSVWRGPVDAHSITYANLPTGVYKFEVFALNSDGIRSIVPASFSFHIQQAYWERWWFILAIIVVIMGGSTMVYVWRVRTMREREKVAEEYSRRLLVNQEVERKRIAQELHDDLGQEFIVISNRAKRGMNFTDEEKVKYQLGIIDESATRALESVREIALDLSPSHIGHFGLVSTVCSMIERLKETSGIDIYMDIEMIDDYIEKSNHIHLYRIIQEAMTNVIKHSKATTAWINILRDDGQIVLCVKDNGIGFPSLSAKMKPSNSGGFGLYGMSERAKMFGGNLSLDSGLEGGSIVQITIPITKAPETVQDQTTS